MAGIFWELLSLSWLALKTFGWRFFITQTWNPVTQVFGAASSIYGTVVSTLIAMALAVPMSIVIALFLVELAPPRLAKVVGTLIELLAAIPSIIYGMWGLFIFAPFMAKYVQPVLGHYFGILPLFQGPPMGIGMLTAGIILAFMILPFITAICRDVFALVPPVLKESGYGVGATTWEVTYKITIPYGIVGVLGGIFLGLGRALGETMAITFVIGNTHRISASLFAPGNSIASCLANEFAEATEPIYLSSLIALGLGAVYFYLYRPDHLSSHVTAPVSGLEHKNMMPRPATGRRVINLLVSLAASMAAFLGIAILLWISVMLAMKGLQAFNFDFFFNLPTPPMVPGGGLANAILGTLILTVLATLMAVPVGLLAGVCLGEYGHNSRLADFCRFAANILTGMPSIIVGIFVYGILVLTLGHFSGFAGAVALAIIMLPVVARTTEDMLRLVPDPLRESALAMGAPRWRVTLIHSLPGCPVRHYHRHSAGGGSSQRRNRTIIIYCS